MAFKYGEDLPWIDYGSLDLPGYGEVFIETYGVNHVVTPDLQTVYVFVNDLGCSDFTFPFDVATGEYQHDKLLITPLDPGDERCIVWPRQPLIRVIRGNALYVLSAIWDELKNWQVKLFDLETREYVWSFDPPTPQAIYDFDVSPSGKLYIAAEDGIFPYWDYWDLSFRIDVQADYIAVGPDRLLYVRDNATGNIDRYTLDSVLRPPLPVLPPGSYFDTFLYAADFGGSFGSIQFGVDGNLHVGAIAQMPGADRPVPTILKLDRDTGQLLSWTDLSGYVEGSNAIYNRITYIPVPEPAAAWLMLVGVVVAGWRTRRQSPSALRCLAG